MPPNPYQLTSLQFELGESLQSAGRISQYRETIQAGDDVYITAGKKPYPGIPQIDPGDLMVFGPYIWGQIGRGSIVLYTIGEKVLIARIARRTLHEGKYALKTNQRVTVKGEENFRFIFPDQLLAVLKVIIRGNQRIPAWRLTRGPADWATDYGTRSVAGKLLDLLLLPVPPSWRPDYKI